MKKFIYLRDAECAILTALECVDNISIDVHAQQAKSHLVDALAQIIILQSK